MSERYLGCTLGCNDFVTKNVPKNGFCCHLPCSFKIFINVFASLSVAANLFTDFMAFDICRCSDNVPIKQKMVYASTNEALKKSFTGIKHMECHDDEEFSYDTIVAKLKQSDRA